MDNYYLKYIKYKNKYIELKGVKGNGSINNIVKDRGDGIYYSKYIKYKTKYLKEKVLVGGVLGTRPCPTTFGVLDFTSKSVWWYIRNYNCTYDDLIKKIPKKINAITFDELYRTNEKPEHALQQITEADLKSRGFPAKFFLKSKGFYASRLKIEGFTIPELIDAGFSEDEIKKAFSENIFMLFKNKDIMHLLFNQEKYCSDIAKYASPETFRQAGISIDDLKKAKTHAKSMILFKFTLKQLIDAGYSAKELMDAGINIIQLINAGFSTKKLKEDGIRAYALKEAKFSASELKEAGFSASELRDAGFSAKKLKAAGFSASELKNEFRASALKDVGFSTSELKEAGFSARELKNEKFIAKTIIDAGYSAEELKEARFSAKNLKESGFSAKKLKEAGFSAKEIIDAGYNAEELIGAEYTVEDLIGLEYNASELKKINVTVKIMKDNGYSAIELICAGYTPEQLISVGYIQEDISKAIYLKRNRFTVKQLTDHAQKELTDYTREQLTDAGYISILEDGKIVYPSAYIDDTLLLLRPRVLKRLFETKDKRIQFLEYKEAYLLFYSKLRVYIYQKYGNNENINNLKTNWKISLYGCHKTDPKERHPFDVNQFNKKQEFGFVNKPYGIYGSELTYMDSWISFVLDNESEKITGHPGNCSGFLIFRLKNDGKILHIFNEDELKKLDYIENSYFKLYNWQKLAQMYDALNLQIILSDWDVLTTVVWNINAVAEYHFITLRDLPFVKNFIYCEKLFLPNVEGQL